MGISSRIYGSCRSSAGVWSWGAGLRLAACMLVVLLWSCRGSGRTDTTGAESVDSLNALSYEYHYKSLRESERLARAALAESERVGSEDGGYEARCHLGFVEYMRMDYESALESFGQVLSGSRNELLKLVAEVGMMRVCQRRSDNRGFYVHRSAAMERMERIRPELRQMTEHQRKLWNYAVSDFYLIQSIYFYYLRQEDEVRNAFGAIADDMELVRGDSAQLTWYYFLGGNTKNINNQLGDDDVQNILRCVALSEQHGYVYLRSKAFSTIAEDIVNAKAMKPSRLVYLRELLNVPDTLSRMELSYSLACRALKDFEEYGSLFDVSQTHIMLSEYHMRMGQNELALKELTKALACVEKAKRLSERSAQRGGDSTAVAPRLQPDGAPVDLLSADGVVHSYEMKWIQDREVCLPEWMADVREHLSIVYAALGMKTESDNNRNIYLDILDATRQDQRMEQHLETLKKEEARLTQMMLVLGGLGILLVALVWGFSRRLKQKYKEHYSHELATAEGEMASWRAKTDEDFSSLEDMEEDVNAERMGFEHRLDEQKKQYIDKTTSLSIVYSITPFLDRAVNEVRKMDAGEDKAIDALARERLGYLMELTDRINLYNDVLTHWIKIRQGAVSLNVESFELGGLFELLSKRTRVFRDKGIDLQVRVTNSVVKADKALTLFMMNTLLENARKFTAEGGRVDLFADDGEDYVEVSVKDTGRGLSAEDVQQILGEKVYDSSRIGDAEHDEDLRRNKGFGFGLMNCKGIIEKYKKSNPIFSVCLFSVESELGKGSRFFFRLPKGRLRSMCIALLMFLGLASAQAGTKAVVPGNEQMVVTAEVDAELMKAREFADSVYFANVDGYHEEALNYVDSACVHLNAYYLKRHPDGELLLHRYEEDAMPEIELWTSGFPTDYHTILDIRNEAAIAALAMKQWDVYYYNNEIYIRLYKLLAQDRTLERYCNEIRAANINKQIVLIVVGMLLLVGLLTYFFFYYHNNILPTFNLRQIVELNRRIFTMKDESALAQMIHDGLGEIKRTEGVALLLNDGVSQFSEGCPEQSHLLQFMQHCMAEQREAVYNGGKVHVFPLTTEEGDGEGEEKMIGAMAVVLHDGSQQKGERQLFQLISSHVATNIYYSQVRMERLRTQIELAEDESRRAEHEANAVHVQNMILDNCLSTIKHETMFYPNRIKQLLTALLAGENKEMEREELMELKELILYYKDIFTILSNCAGRQLETVLFKRKLLLVEDLAEYASRSIFRQGKKLGLHVDFVQGTGQGLRIVADKVMMEYLFDNIISFFMQYKKDGTICLNFVKSEEFVKFALSFDGADMTAEQFHSLFYPENLQHDAHEDKLTGAQMLVAKQIVREHDEHVRRGCRIYAEPADAETGKGIAICFTIPAQRGEE